MLALGWYRFLNVTGIRMATECPDQNRCNTNFPGWLQGRHPTVHEGIVKRNVCFNKNGCCQEMVYNIEVKNCGSYFVYYLKPTQGCNKRYCYTNTSSE